MIYFFSVPYIGFTTKIILLNSKKSKILEQSRYFAYELVIAPGQVMGQEPRFAFCEWGKNNVHSNMGFLKDASREAFINHILRNIDDELSS